MKKTVTPGSTKAGKAISKALADLLAEARAAGCKNPNLFFEPESGAVFVMDGDHRFDHDDRANAEERQQAIVLCARIATPFDAGAW